MKLFLGEKFQRDYCLCKKRASRVAKNHTRIPIMKLFPKDKGQKSLVPQTFWQKEKVDSFRYSRIKTINLIWLRRRDLNPRPPGYEPDELPDCSTPRYFAFVSPIIIPHRRRCVKRKIHRPLIFLSRHAALSPRCLLGIAETLRILKPDAAAQGSRP